ncbi:MAG: AAA family ATPase [Patescibacteria group bacterium]
MIKKLDLQNFRNYSRRTFDFESQTSLIVGPNASGKTNIFEAIYALAIGKSFRAETEQDVIKENENFSSIKADNLEILFDNRGRFIKIYKVNGVRKRQGDFVGTLRAVLFCPQDLEIATDSPSTRRKYLDSALTQIFKDYRLSTHIYEKALRQRNRLLWRIREEHLDRNQLGYWNKLLIENGKIIHERRRDYLKFLGLDYDHSVISEERLERYINEEIAAAITLVGPHRDDFKIIKNNKNIRSFGSRGEQRLAVFAIKMGELEYVEKITGVAPLLLLDDIFSELDHANRRHILEVIPRQQTIMTTTDLHLVEKAHLKNFQLIELG